MYCAKCSRPIKQGVPIGYPVAINEVYIDTLLCSGCNKKPLDCDCKPLVQEPRRTIDCYEQVINSNTYKSIILHRRTCPKWGNNFCLDCFGTGLNAFFDGLVKEGILEMTLKKITVDEAGRMTGEIK
jgi:hypothetical protein